MALGGTNERMSSTNEAVAGSGVLAFLVGFVRGIFCVSSGVLGANHYLQCAKMVETNMVPPPHPRPAANRGTLSARQLQDIRDLTRIANEGGPTYGLPQRAAGPRLPTHITRQLGGRRGREADRKSS